MSLGSLLRRKLLCLSAGPHFVEYLSFKVTPECNVLLICKVKSYT